MAETKSSEKWTHRWIRASRVMDFISIIKERLDTGTLHNSAELREIAEGCFLYKQNYEPCVKCGKNDAVGVYHYDNMGYIVECSRCGLIGSRYKDTEDEAIQSWNYTMKHSEKIPDGFVALRFE